jgi:hypothetical protein
MMLGKTPPIKYGDPGNPAVTVKIGQTYIPNVLVDLRVLHIIFIIPMMVNDVNLYVSFRGVSSLSSWREKGEELFLRKEVVFSLVKTLLKRKFTGCYIGRVWECLILVGCTIARVRDVRRLLYRQGVRMPTHGKHKCFLESSRRRSFYGEVASEWFGSYSLSWFSGIILTSSPYPLQLIKGEEFS